MKTYIANHLVAFLMALVLFSCSNTDEPAAPSGEKTPMTFDCLIGVSRATDTKFEVNDKIGIFVVKKGDLIQPAGNVVNNEPFTFDGSKWTSSRKVYWDEGSFDVYAYYPHSAKVTDTENFSFQVSEDQSTHAGYTASDFIWAAKKGVSASANPVTLNFSHSLSKAVIKIEKGEGFTGSIPTDCEVFIHSTATVASVDIASGNASTAEISPITSIKAFKKDNTTFEAIVVPQSIQTRRPLIEVVTQGVSYLMEGKISFRPGYSHNIIITLTKNPEQTKIEIGGSIGGWGE